MTGASIGFGCCSSSAIRDRHEPQALGQAREGRIHILGEMAKALTAARAELGEYAPRIETFKIATDKIREVIGTGGKVIREIVEKTGAKVNIEDDGTVKVASANGESIRAAIKWIKSITSDPEVGQIYDGTVVKVPGSPEDYSDEQLASLLTIFMFVDFMESVPSTSVYWFAAGTLCFVGKLCKPNLDNKRQPALLSA